MSSYKDDYIPSNKRSRGKKQRPSGSRRQHANSFDQDEADTIEKRNLHNDMERQRRIGLKNLFEALKRQIPSIKDKDRAPKVNILREAAKLCEQLTREENQAQTMKQQLLMQLQRRQAHLKMLKVQGAWIEWLKKVRPGRQEDDEGDTKKYRVDEPRRESRIMVKPLLADKCIDKGLLICS